MTEVTQKEKMRAWVEALESGEYEQCQNKLSDGSGFCCLGVYAKINNIPFKVFVEGEERDDNHEAYEKVNAQVGGYIYHEGIEMNDYGKSFKEIAKMIREECRL